jgi:hypothetical protein
MPKQTVAISTARQRSSLMEIVFRDDRFTVMICVTLPITVSVLPDFN